ncbi:hypothetical protein M0813_08581 [Anaeramoeba flamelloides]|uniref:Uncharacterized protein n=1 Tax=Anaeramoeba flamelloides TaxID=1746091 RepID=A0ABQ8X8Q1_9EUKA|nr:hypothetical protein M0813_08581 [Anaeramoeba flamelloides]
MNKHEKYKKKKFGRFSFKTKITQKKKQNAKKTKNTKTDKIKSAFRKKLKGRSRKEKSAVTALFVLSTKNKQKQKEQEKKKTQLLQTLENGLNTEKKQQQKQQQQQLNKDRELDLNQLRSLYTQYKKPVVKHQKQEPQRQQLDCGFLRNRLTQPETQANEDTASPYDQFEDESYDDSLSEDLASSSYEEFSNHTENSQDSETNVTCYPVSDEEMESLGDEIEIQFGGMQNEQNIHHLIFPEKISFVSGSYGIPTSYPQEYLYENY